MMPQKNNFEALLFIGYAMFKHLILYLLKILILSNETTEKHSNIWAN